MLRENVLYRYVPSPVAISKVGADMSMVALVLVVIRFGSPEIVNYCDL
jgi:hypothetical protein